MKNGWQVTKHYGKGVIGLTTTHAVTLMNTTDTLRLIISLTQAVKGVSSDKFARMLHKIKED